MIAIVVALCSSVGALAMFQGAQGAPGQQVNVMAGCSMFSKAVPLPIVGVIVGPVKDSDGDKMWLIKVTNNLFSITWDEPRPAA